MSQKQLSAEDVRFCHLLTMEISHTEAYRKCYGAEGHANDAAVKQAAYRKAHDPAIVEYVADLKEALAEGHGLNEELILAEKMLALKIAKDAKAKTVAERCKQANTIDAITTEIAKIIGVYREPAKGTGGLDHMAFKPNFGGASGQSGRQISPFEEAVKRAGLTLDDEPTPPDGRVPRLAVNNEAEQ